MQLKIQAAHILQRACMAEGLRTVEAGNKKNLHLQKRLTAGRLKANMHAIRSRE